MLPSQETREERAASDHRSTFNESLCVGVSGMRGLERGRASTPTIPKRESTLSTLPRLRKTYGQAGGHTSQA